MQLRHCERSDAIDSPARGDVDCFAEPVIGRIRATHWLAMTAWQRVADEAKRDPGYGDDVGSYRFTLACSAELCATSASLAEIAAVSAGVPQLGASLPLPQARGR